ncbi:YqfO family protein [Methylophaga sp. OBS1]|uniref:Nif3-like dinuclear metal center hexameric protein n=1 Tax=Methylophaga sp. OBS1 TaxID=2991933 RepID=UPI00224D7774|nr:YqfO family protein [Methylophaga sp. OBS1]MCX4193147.1 YqfO family protein [Methylophaga sp. OBS1]
MTEPLLKLVFFVPESHKESVKAAIFAAGAGHYDGYDCCSWESQGTGQFRPLDGSDPFIGKQGEIERVGEFRVETVCPASSIKTILQALISAHPYETPAYEVWSVKTIDDF